MALLGLRPGVAADAVTRLRIGVPMDSAPLSFVDKQGRATGFTPELLRELEKVSGIAIELVPNWWAVNGRAFDAGELDALSNVTSTDKDLAKYNHSIVSGTVQGVTYTRPDRPAPRRTANFRGKRVGALRGTVALVHADKHSGSGAPRSCALIPSKACCGRPRTATAMSPCSPAS
jgi:ABC-type amino acid transport substrate-binding protein